MPALQEGCPATTDPSWRTTGPPSPVHSSMKNIIQRKSLGVLPSSQDSKVLVKSFSGPSSFNKPFQNVPLENNPAKPRIVTVVKPSGRKQLRKISILLNRHSVQTFEQLVADISEALGLQYWKNNGIKQLFSLKGREIRSISDFFRGDDIFIAAGRKTLTLTDVQQVLQDIYPDSPYSQNALQQDWERSCQLNCSPHRGSEVTKQPLRSNVPSKAALNLERVRAKAKQEERERARRWEQERLDKQHRRIEMVENKLQPEILCDKCRKAAQAMSDETNSRPQDQLYEVRRKQKCFHGEEPEVVLKSRRRGCHTCWRNNRPCFEVPAQEIKDSFKGAELHQEVLLEKTSSDKEVQVDLTRSTTPVRTASRVQESSDTQQSRSRHMATQDFVESLYEIGRVIGDGNFAVVKECKPHNGDTSYAMKIIDKAKLKGKEHMIENEISIIKSLSHPNIVRLLEEYESEQQIFLIMEYIQGGDLFDAITESVKFTEHNAALIITDLCQALAYIHSKNIVHRDLKPENLLVQPNKDGTTTLKLADFGLAMQVTRPIFTVCGTPTYVAPEILSERGYGLEVDIWATGVILYILLCGFPPFRSPQRNQEELFEIIQLGEYEFLSPYWDNISDSAKNLISKLLVVNPQERHTAQQVLQHPWVQMIGKVNERNLQREVTTNIERHFGTRRRRLGDLSANTNEQLEEIGTGEIKS